MSNLAVMDLIMFHSLNKEQISIWALTFSRTSFTLKELYSYRFFSKLNLIIGILTQFTNTATITTGISVMMAVLLIQLATGVSASVRRVSMSKSIDILFSSYYNLSAILVFVLHLRSKFKDLGQKSKFDKFFASQGKRIFDAFFLCTETKPINRIFEWLKKKVFLYKTST